MDEEALKDSVAIVGMAGRFPGARNVAELWRNIAAGVRSIRTFSDQELLARGVSPEELAQPNYVKAGTVIDEVDRFDAAFFGYPPREAAIMDPQHRLFLECAWQALEDSGCDPLSCRGVSGVFAGSAASTYPRPRATDPMTELQAGLFNSQDTLAPAVSYKLNLRGPSVSVQTFCSTSLVAVHMACQSLLNFECDLALAGGVALSFPYGVGYLYQEGGIVSPDGHCRSYDARAQGSVMGNGVGVVVLKRLEDALAEGDRIYAVIRGSAVNNDGLRKVGFTAPGLEGQTAVFVDAMAHAGVAAESIGYVEGHGTATRLGDAVELEAMTQAFRRSTAKTAFCGLGSVKASIGHLDRASGVAGLIKAALTVYHGVIPPSLDFEGASGDVELGKSPFYVNTALREWPREEWPRRAGVSSFGLGGTNAHVVLEEAPQQQARVRSEGPVLLVWSAKTASALEAMTERLREYLAGAQEADLGDVGWTLATGRAEFNHRRMLVSASREDAVRGLLEGRYETREQTGRGGEAAVEGKELAEIGREWASGRRRAKGSGW